MLSYFIFNKTAKECRFLPYHILQANTEKCLGRSSAASITNVPLNKRSRSGIWDCSQPATKHTAAYWALC